MTNVSTGLLILFIGLPGFAADLSPSPDACSVPKQLRWGASRILASALGNLQRIENNTFACHKHDVCDLSVPACPESEGPLGPEYPVMALSISDQNNSGDSVVKLIDTIKKANPAIPPQFFLNVSPETFTKIQESIQNEKQWSEGEKQRWVSALTRIPGPTISWHQDNFEVYQKNGMPVVRRFENFDYSYQDSLQKSFQNMLKKISSTCEIPIESKQIYSPLDVHKKIYNYETKKNQVVASGSRKEYRGGNIEPGPSGYCIIGRASEPDDTKWNAFKKSACPGQKTVEIDTSPLRVGHVDEILKVVKTKKGKCGYALLALSPMMAWKLIKANPEERVFQFDHYPRKTMAEIVAYRMDAELARLCSAFAYRDRHKESGEWYEKTSKTHNCRIDGNHEYCHAVQFCNETIKGKDYIELYQNPNHTVLAKRMKYLQFFDTHVRKQALKVAAKIRKEVPDCQNFSPVYIPTFISATEQKNKSGKTEIKSVTASHGNPINGIQFEDQFISSTTNMPVLDREISRILKSKLGLVATFLADYPAVQGATSLAGAIGTTGGGGGGLHCRSHLFRYCRPVKPGICR